MRKSEFSYVILMIIWFAVNLFVAFLVGTFYVEQDEFNQTIGRQINEIHSNFEAAK